MQVAALVAALVIAFAVRSLVPGRNIFAWLLLILLVGVARLVFWYRFARIDDTSFRTATWRRAYLLMAFISGSAWGLSALLIYPAGDLGLIFIFVLVVASLAAAATISHASVRLGSTAWSVPALTAYAARCFYMGSGFERTIALLIVVFLITIIIYSNYHEKFIASTISLRFENQKLLDEVRESEQRFKSLIRTIPDMVWLKDPKGAFITCNASTERFLQTSESEIVGKTEGDFYSAQEAESFQRKGKEVMAGGGPQVTQEWISTRGDARRVLVETIRTPFYDATGQLVGVLGIARDITDRRKAEETLRLMEHSINILPEAAFWLDPEGHFVYVSDSACQSTGYSRAELMDLTVFDINPKVNAATWAEVWREARERKTIRRESVHRRRDGSIFPVEISSTFIRFDEREYLCGFARDLTERKKAEEEQRQLQIQMQHAQKLESLGVLAGGLAHDFNNILQAIQGNAELALYELPDGSGTRHSLQEIGKALRSAADVTRQMLAYAGRGQFQIRLVDLSEVAGEMVQLLKASVSKKTTIEMDLAKRLPAIKADVAQLQQVVMNLILNASEALDEEGGGRVEVSTYASMCTGEYLRASRLPEKAAPGQYVFLEVTDRGCGMDQAVLEKLFDPFFTTKFAGRGLGMAAVLGIVRSHAGAIMVDSAPGVGTKVRVLFPAADRDAPPLAIPELWKSENLWTGRGAILLVDDEHALRDVGRRMLELMGFEVIEASDGIEALDAYSRQRDSIVCIVLDLSMPRLDGEQTLVELQKINLDVPVVMTSGFAESQIEDQFAGKTIAAFIQKPFKLAALRDTLQSILGG